MSQTRERPPPFKPVGWSDRGNFDELLAPPMADNKVIEFKPAAQKTAELIADEIPF